MKNHFIAVFLGLLLFLGGGYCFAEAIPFEPDQWQYFGLNNTELGANKEDCQSEKTLDPNSPLLKNTDNKEVIYLPAGCIMIAREIKATDGTIEYDIAFEHQPGDGNLSYLGHVWHFQDPQDYEHFYIRPQHSGENKSTQYTPVIKGLNSDVWYRQFPIKNTYSCQNEWCQIKFVMSGDYAELYVNSEKFTTFPQHAISKSGHVGLMSGGKFESKLLKGGYYANFSFTPEIEEPIKDPPDELLEEIEKNQSTIHSWLISDVIEDKSLEGKLRLTEDDRQIGWTELPADTFGLANFIKLPNLIEEKNKKTVFARTTLISDKDQVKQLRILYHLQNFIRVYLNGRLLFVSPNQEGEDRVDNYEEMKEVYLPLKNGENELWIALTDIAPGGWGIKAYLDNSDKSIEVTTARSGINFDDPTRDCMAASYSLDGNLHIPCVIVPNSGDPADGTTVFQVDMNQNPLFNTFFQVDVDSMNVVQ